MENTNQTPTPDNLPKGMSGIEITLIVVIIAILLMLA